MAGLVHFSACRPSKGETHGTKLRTVQLLERSKDIREEAISARLKLITSQLQFALRLAHWAVIDTAEGQPESAVKLAVESQKTYERTREHLIRIPVGRDLSRAMMLLKRLEAALTKS